MVGGEDDAYYGSSRAKQEMRIFSKCMHICHPEHCVLITPSEVTGDITNISMNWSQTWWLDSNLFDGFLCGAWNVHVRPIVTLTCFDQNPAGATTVSLDGKCEELGEMFPPDPKGVMKHCAIENSSGLTTTIRAATGISRLSVTSQLATFSLREAKTPQINWPTIREEYRLLSTGEQIAMIGGVTEWLGESLVNKDESIDDWWRLRPKGFLNATIPEMMGIDITNTDGDGPTQTNPSDGMQVSQLTSQSTPGASSTFRAGGINPQ